jgi:hypothetical protein
MSTGASNPLKRLKGRDARPLRVDPNEEAYEALKDAENIGRDAHRRELRSYTGEEEDTKRTNVHVHLHSKPSSDPTELEVGPVKVRGLPKWLVVLLGAIVAAVTALVAHFAR